MFTPLQAGSQDTRRKSVKHSTSKEEQIGLHNNHTYFTILFNTYPSIVE